MIDCEKGTNPNCECESCRPDKHVRRLYFIPIDQRVNELFEDHLKTKVEVNKLVDVVEQLTEICRTQQIAIDGLAALADIPSLDKPRCPECGNDKLGLLRTIDGGQKHCIDCDTNFPWKLAVGQKTLS